MPIISIEQERHINELIGVSLLNKNFRSYSFSDVYEIIELKINEEGVIVENEGEIFILGSSFYALPPKLLMLNR